MSFLNSVLKVFVGDKSKHVVSAITPIVNQIKTFEGALEQLSHDELRAKTLEFKSKIAENFQNEYTMKDFAKTITPFAIVTLTKTDGTEKTVKFIPYQKTSKQGELIKQDSDTPVFRFHADCSWGDFMVVQQGVFGKVFWGYESFYK